MYDQPLLVCQFVIRMYKKLTFSVRRSSTTYRHQILNLNGFSKTFLAFSKNFFIEKKFCNEKLYVLFPVTYSKFLIIATI